jgi:hypothetical protein
MLYICALCVVSTAVAQRYDYDDIYFNPKKDIQKSTDNRVQSTDDIEQMIDSSQFSIINSQLSYTARINMFHRTDTDSVQNRLAHIADPNYTTNVFVLTDGQYVVDVDGNNIEITYTKQYLNGAMEYETDTVPIEAIVEIAVALSLNKRL